MYYNPEEKKSNLQIRISSADKDFKENLMAAMETKKTVENVTFMWKKQREHFESEDDSVEEKLEYYTRLFLNEVDIQGALDKLFGKSDEDYYKCLVSNEEARKAKFSIDTRKARAIVVTGKSGSGKTSFAKQYL